MSDKSRNSRLRKSSIARQRYGKQLLSVATNNNAKEQLLEAVYSTRSVPRRFNSSSRLRWREPAATINYRPVLSSEMALQNNNPQLSKRKSQRDKKLGRGSQMGAWRQDGLADWLSVVIWLRLRFSPPLGSFQGAKWYTICPWFSNFRTCMITYRNVSRQQAEAIRNHRNANIRNIGRGEAQRKKKKM
jgi:hypothetical protein